MSSTERFLKTRFSRCMLYRYNTAICTDWNLVFWYNSLYLIPEDVWKEKWVTFPLLFFCYSSANMTNGKCPVLMSLTSGEHHYVNHSNYMIMPRKWPNLTGRQCYLQKELTSAKQKGCKSGGRHRFFTSSYFYGSLLLCSYKNCNSDIC